MAAIQCLSDRMVHYEQTGTGPNQTSPDGNNRAPQPLGLRNSVGPPEPPPNHGDWSEDEGGDGEDELIVEEKLKGILLAIVPFKVQSWSPCPTMLPTSELGKIL